MGNRGGRPCEVGTGGDGRAWTNVGGGQSRMDGYQKGTVTCGWESEGDDYA